MQNILLSSVHKRNCQLSKSGWKLSYLLIVYLKHLEINESDYLQQYEEQ